MKNISLLLLLSLTILSSACQSKSEKTVVADKVSMEAQPFPLSDLRLLPGSPFKHAMDKNGEWLLDLSADRLLHRFRLNAGLTPQGEIYGGLIWVLAWRGKSGSLRTHAWTLSLGMCHDVRRQW